MDLNSKPLVMREYPIALWLIGLFLAGGSAYLYTLSPAQPILSFIMIGIGVLFLLFASVTTITVNRIGNLLTIHHRSLLTRSRKEIQISDIDEIRIERSSNRSANMRSSQPTFRLAVACKDGQVIPIHGYYTSGWNDKQRKAAELSSYLGLEKSTEAGPNLFQMASKLAQPVLQEKQAALTGSLEPDQVTDGVHWKLQTVAFGGTPFTRWFSPDAKMSGTFLFLAQKVQGQGNLGGGFLGSLGKMLSQQALSMYGYNEEDTPNKEFAEVLAPLDPKLEPHFSAFTGDPDKARNMLTPWTMIPLAAWTTRHPLRQMQQMGFSQLTVLFSPRGTYVATLGSLNPDQLEEFTQLGVEIVKSQGPVG